MFNYFQKVVQYLTGKKEKEDVYTNDIEMFDIAVRMATEAHSMQLDKNGDLYILHPMRNCLRCQHNYQLMTVAILHDVVEDCGIDMTDFRKLGFPVAIDSAIDALSRRKDEDYLKSYIPRVLREDMAVVVKMFDLEDNMGHMGTKNISDEEKASLMKRYAKAKKMIQEKFDKVVSELLPAQ